MSAKYFPVIIVIVTSTIITLVTVLIAVRAKRRREEYPYGGHDGYPDQRRSEYESRYRQPRRYNEYYNQESYPGAQQRKSSKSIFILVAVGLALLGMIGFLVFYLMR